MGRKVDCIERLIEINHSYEEICEWLVLNKFVEDTETKEFTRTREKADFIYSTLKDKQTSGDVILLYFEWTLLPIESIKITCVTPNEEKFFTYGT